MKFCIHQRPTYYKLPTLACAVHAVVTGRCKLVHCYPFWRSSWVIYIHYGWDHCVHNGVTTWHQLIHTAMCTSSSQFQLHSIHFGTIKILKANCIVSITSNENKHARIGHIRVRCNLIMLASFVCQSNDLWISENRFYAKPQNWWRKTPGEDTNTPFY